MENINHGRISGSTLILYQPRLSEMDFRRRLIGDEKTMAYNHAYGGTISFPEECWNGWYQRWFSDPSGKRFYRYLKDTVRDQFVGEVSYHFDEARDYYICDVIVLAYERGNGFGRQGLLLLCDAARANGIPCLYDDIAIDNPSVELFLSCGFEEVYRNQEYILVRKSL